MSTFFSITEGESNSIFVRLSVCQYLSLFVCLSFCPYVRLSVCQYVSISVCLSVCQGVCRGVCLSVCRGVCLLGCLSVCLFVCHFFLTICARLKIIIKNNEYEGRHTLSAGSVYLIFFAQVDSILYFL